MLTLIPKNISMLLGASSKRCLHVTPRLLLKEIRETKEGNELKIEGVIVESPRTPYLIKTQNDSVCCSLCRLNLNIKHTDVLILSQFVRSDGLMLPRRITGLCNLQQRRMQSLVSMAHIAGLMPNLVPKYSKPNCFKKRREWKKFNTYFDESTIKFIDKWYRRGDGDTKRNYYEQKFGIVVKDVKEPLYSIPDDMIPKLPVIKKN